MRDVKAIEKDIEAAEREVERHAADRSEAEREMRAAKKKVDLLRDELLSAYRGKVK